jgi:NAD(P) transhydrogenase subunit beta
MNMLEFVPAILILVMFLGGIRLMNSPRTALAGNLLGSLGMLLAVIYTLFTAGIANKAVILVPMGAGIAIGYFLSVRVVMIEMPQLVALLNGLGGGASALTAHVVMIEGDPEVLISSLALLVGALTLSGSVLAAAKLARFISQKPVVLPFHSILNAGIFIFAITLVGLMVYYGSPVSRVSAVLLFIVSLTLGAVITVRIG